MTFEFNRLEQWLLRTFHKSDFVAKVVATMNLMRRNQLKSLRQESKKSLPRVMKWVTIGFKLQKARQEERLR